MSKGVVDDGFDIGIRRSWEKALYEVKAGAADLMRYQPARLLPEWRPRLCGVRGGGARSGETAWVCLRLHRRLHGHRVTHAGILVGFAEDGRQRNVIGIDASATPAKTKAQVLKIAQYTAELVDLETELVQDDIVLLEDYAYPRYGIPSEGTEEAIRLCARLEGIITDPVYEGRSMQGMIDLVQRACFRRGRGSSTRISAARRLSTGMVTPSATADARQGSRRSLRFY